MVDSTVDSTSGYFMVPSPPPPVFNGNEAAHEGGDSSDDEGADTESIPGEQTASQLFCCLSRLLINWVV